MTLGEIPVDIHADGYFINTGDAMMNLGVYDGDRVFVDLGAPFENGDIVVVNVDGETLLRQIWCSEDGNIILTAANYKYATLCLAGWDNAEYIGRAVCLNRLLNARDNAMLEELIYPENQEAAT